MGKRMGGGRTLLESRRLGITAGRTKTPRLGGGKGREHRPGIAILSW